MYANPGLGDVQATATDIATWMQNNPGLSATGLFVVLSLASVGLVETGRQTHKGIKSAGKRVRKSTKRAAQTTASAGGNVLKFIGLGALGYFAWQWWQGQGGSGQ